MGKIVTIAPSTGELFVEDAKTEKAKGVETLQTKVCKCCGKILPLSSFNKNNKTADRLSNKCKECFGKRKKTAPKVVKDSVDVALMTVRQIPQPGRKATLCLSDFTDSQLSAELRRRGYTGKITRVTELDI